MREPPFAADLHSALLGTWTVDRRASPGAGRFVQVRFYRDGRFGTRTGDGRTTVYGHWHLAGSGQAQGTRLTMQFDHWVVPRAEYLLTMAHGPLGRVVLADPNGHGTRVVLARAGAIDAALVGVWRAPPGETSRGESALDGLELHADGEFTLRLTGGAVRQGRWSFERDPDTARTGWLVLDPAEVVFPIERWAVALEARQPATLTVQREPDGTAVRLSRPTLDPVLHALVAHWRRIGTEPEGGAQELSLRADGTLDALAAPGLARTPGRWTFTRRHGPPAALEGVLSLALQRPGAAATVTRWRLVLGFAPGAELKLQSDDGRVTVRYRRLFR